MEETEIKDILSDILKWIKVIGSDNLKDKVMNGNLLFDEKQIIAYQNSDGTKSSRNIGEIAGLSHVQIQRLWKSWISAGIAEAGDRYNGGQCRKLFELIELGVEEPKSGK